MNDDEKNKSIIEQVIGFFFGRGDFEDERELEKTGAIIYAVMDFVFEHKHAENLTFDLNYFCFRVRNEKYSCAEAVQFGTQQGWIEESADKITITDAGIAYEKDFWKSFR